MAKRTPGQLQGGERLLRNLQLTREALAEVHHIVAPHGFSLRALRSDVEFTPESWLMLTCTKTSVAPTPPQLRLELNQSEGG